MPRFQIANTVLKLNLTEINHSGTPNFYILFIIHLLTGGAKLDQSEGTGLNLPVVVVVTPPLL